MLGIRGWGRGTQGLTCQGHCLCPMGLGLPGCPSAHSTHCFCVADGLYRQSAPEFRVASSVEQLNIIEVGAHRGEGRGCAMAPRPAGGGGRAQRTGPVRL